MIAIALHQITATILTSQHYKPIQFYDFLRFIDIVYVVVVVILPNFIAFGFCGAIVQSLSALLRIQSPLIVSVSVSVSSYSEILFGLPKYTLCRQAVTDSQVNDLQLSLLSVRWESATKISSRFASRLLNVVNDRHRHHHRHYDRSERPSKPTNDKLHSSRCYYC